MKIRDHQTIPKVVKFPKTSSANAPAAKPSGAPGVDRVSLSPQARELLKAQQSLASLPDVREDKVAEIRTRLEAGDYRIDSEAIAEKMIREGLSGDE